MANHVDARNRRVISRIEMLLILATMPDEAFGWFVSWCMTGYPEGLGGFTPESKKAIKQLQRAAEEYTNTH